MAFRNIFNNCVNYANTPSANITISSSDKSIDITILNDGKTLSDQEQKYMFQRFFRGENSAGIQGFGLGLVFIKKIIELHNGIIIYNVNSDGLNEFLISFQLQK